MSKKYKLIKTYPGSPRLGVIEEPIDVKCHMMSNGHYGYDFENKEFWEEVIEKDYKILVIQTNVHGRLSDFSKDSEEFIDSILRCEGTSIHSVKRLSDGKVFNVGDKTNKGFIKGFMRYNDVLHCTCKDQSLFYNGNINKLNIIKKPLFTTEDGVDIFEGDKYYALALTFKPVFREAIYNEIGRSNISYDYNDPEKRKVLNNNGRYYFSTVEKAEECILVNKPCLCLNDIYTKENGITPLHKLIEIVKKKINEKTKCT